MTAAGTTFDRARAGYDAEHETALTQAIITAIAEASKVSDIDCCVIRTGEAAAALVSVLALMLAMSPSVTRSPTAIRKMMDELHKRLRQGVAAAEHDPEVRDFVRRTFRSNDVGGHG